MTSSMTPRRVLVSSWRGAHAYLAEVLASETADNPLAAREVLILTETTAGALLLRSALEERLLRGNGALILPTIKTVSGLFNTLAERTLGRVRMADPLLAQALLEAAFEETSAVSPPPFSVGRGLAPKVLQFRETLHAAGHTLDEFARRAGAEFDVPGDPGAERMAAQTRFLVESLNRYEEKLLSRGLFDLATRDRAPYLEHARFPWKRVLALGDLSPAELAFLAGVEGITALEIVFPESSETQRADSRDAELPVLLTPERADEPCFVARDREEVLYLVARLLKARAREGTLPPLDRIAVVVPRPLPYLYLAKRVFTEAGIPFELQDDFPLASEPIAAALDLLLDFAEEAGRRNSALALLRSPWFGFLGVDPESIRALDNFLTAQRSAGGHRFFKFWKERGGSQPSLPGLEAIARREPFAPALEALAAAGASLGPLADPRATVRQKVEAVSGFLADAGLPVGDERALRARGAIQSILDRIASAAAEVRDTPATLADFRALLHRAIESHTFSEGGGSTGVRVVDARSARAGAFDLVLLMGLNEGEWPARLERNIFYPQWLLGRFGWPSDRETLALARREFIDLVRLAAREVALFRHQLEDDVPTVPSPFLDEAPSATSRRVALPVDELSHLLVSRSQALRAGYATANLPPRFARYAIPGRVEISLPAPTPLSVTALELFLHCPFKYFSRHVLGLEEEEDVEEGPTPRQRGRDVHLVLKTAFERWDFSLIAPGPHPRGVWAEGSSLIAPGPHPRGVWAEGSSHRPRAITAENYTEAVAFFRKVAEEILPLEGKARALEALFGTGPAGEAGAVEWILREEMTREPLRRRLLEFPFSGTYSFRLEPVWTVDVKGRADRVDVDTSGGLHLYDYKSGKAPDPKTALQAVLYALCLEEDLGARAVEAAYLSLRDKRQKRIPPGDFDAALRRARQSWEAIGAGRFPPQPHPDNLCYSCGYSGVCRLEIQEEEETP